MRPTVDPLLRGAVDNAFTQAGKCRINLYRGAGLITAGKRNLLVDDGQNPTGCGVSNDNASVQSTQSVYGSPTDREVFPVDFVPGSGVSKSRFKPGTAGDQARTSTQRNRAELPTSTQTSVPPEDDVGFRRCTTAPD